MFGFLAILFLPINVLLNVAEMPRTYKRKPGSRRYRDYTENHLQECIRRIRCGEITQRQGEMEYQIPRRTLVYKLARKHSTEVGRPAVFTDAEESVFVKCTLQLSDYGFPISEEDLRYIVSAYLQKAGRIVPQFKMGNFPGVDWSKCFLKRHPELTTRFVSNIKRAR
uniref:HTH psq-type domain-containing protein n=1 Tax=Cacopsylla melanoneura TaxID=428564 RepID=A0A8D9BI12_9HEMI